MDEDVVPLQITITDELGDPESLDAATMSLISQFQDLNVDSVEYKTSGEVVIGSKGDPITIGVILLGIAYASLPGLMALVQNWVSERRKVVIETNGTKVEFIPDKKYSEQEVLELVHKVGQAAKGPKTSQK